MVVDVFDASALARAVVAANPDVVIHQLTDLPSGLDQSRMSEGIKRNARIRDEGTRNLVEAAIAAGARRLVAQSIAWAYAPGPEPHCEDDPLDLATEGNRAISVHGIAALEKRTLATPSLDGTVLRYGQLCEPGTGTRLPTGSAPLHVDAAAHAALLAVERDVSGVFNIAGSNQYVATEKASLKLGWRAEFRLSPALEQIAGQGFPKTDGD